MNSKKNILIISTNADLGGAPIHVQTLVRYLDNYKYRIQLIFGQDGFVSDSLRDDGFNLTNIATLTSKINLYNDFISFLRICNIIKKERPNLIHCHSSKAALLGRMAALIFRVPVLYTVHGWGWRGFGYFKSELFFILEYIFKFIPNNYFICVSNSVLDEAISKLNLSYNKCRLIHNGTKDFAHAKKKYGDDCVIMMPARVCSAKDHETLVRAFNLLNFNAKLILCGAGTDDLNFKDKLVEWAPRKHLDIICMGEVVLIEHLLSNCDIFVLSSNFEALPISIIEAMSAFKPIIASNVGGIPELIQDRYNGLLFECGNINELVNKIIELHNNKQMGVTLGNNARQTYENEFNVRLMIDKTEMFYQEILDENS